MPWFAAHAIMYYQLTDGPQNGFQVYENVFLVEAGTANEGFAKARELARRDEGDSSSPSRVAGRPAKLVFGGIRKLISVCHERPDEQIGHGDEITYSEFVVPNRDALERLIVGSDVDVEYVGDHPEAFSGEPVHRHSPPS